MFDEYINTDQIYWYLTRSAGLMTWLAACGSIIVGLLMGSKMFGRRPGQPWLLDLHRYLSAMALVFLGVHLLTLWLDDFVDFGVEELFIPGTAVPNYTTLGISFGVLSGWLMLVVQLTSVFKDYFPHRFWHSIHLFSFVVVFMGAYHGFDTGSEADNVLVLSLGASLLAAIVMSTIARVIGSRQAKKYKDFRTQELKIAKQKISQEPQETLVDRF